MQCTIVQLKTSTITKLPFGQSLFHFFPLWMPSIRIRNVKAFQLIFVFPKHLPLNRKHSLGHTRVWNYLSYQEAPKQSLSALLSTISLINLSISILLDLGSRT